MEQHGELNWESFTKGDSLVENVRKVILKYLSNDQVIILASPLSPKDIGRKFQATPRVLKAMGYYSVPLVHKVTPHLIDLKEIRKHKASISFEPDIEPVKSLGNILLGVLPKQSPQNPVIVDKTINLLMK